MSFGLTFLSERYLFSFFLFLKADYPIKADVRACTVANAIGDR